MSHWNKEKLTCAAGALGHQRAALERQPDAGDEMAGGERLDQEIGGSVLQRLASL